MPKSPPKSHLATLIMAWMALFGMIGTALIGPNRLSIQHEFGLNHEQFGAAFAIIQIVCSIAVLTIAARIPNINSLSALILSLIVQIAGFITVYFAHTSYILALGWSFITLGIVILYSSTWATFYAQAARFFPPATRHLLDFGTALGNALGIATCVYISSALAETSLDMAMFFCVAVLWLFGAIYYTSPLARHNISPIVT